MQLTLRVFMAGIKWHAVFILYSGVELALHIVNGLWNQIQFQLPISEKVIQKSYQNQLMSQYPTGN